MEEILAVFSDPNVLILIGLLVGTFVFTMTGMVGMLFVCEYFGWLF